MSLSADLQLTKNDIIQKFPRKILIGSKEKISISVFEDNGEGGILNPITFLTSNETITIVKCSDHTIPILTDSATKTNITDNNTATIIGYELSYIIDTTIISDITEYIIIFSYDKDNFETKKIPIFFNIIDLSCPLIPDC